MNKPTLYILCGLSFAGKSTLGKALINRFGFEPVDVDVTKERLYGKGLKDDDLTHDQWVTIYDETDKQIAGYLHEAKSVIDDSRNFRKFERIHAKEIAEKAHADFITIYIKTPEDIVRQRWIKNRKYQTRHDVEDKDFEEIVTIFEPPTEDENPLVFNHGDTIENLIQKNFSKR